MKTSAPCCWTMQGYLAQKFMHDLPNVQMLLSATKECCIRELFGNQLPPPYNFSKNLSPHLPEGFSTAFFSNYFYNE